MVGLAHAICAVCRMNTACSSLSAAGFVPYPYNEQMYHRIQTAMVAGGANGEGTILLMREDALTGRHQAGAVPTALFDMVAGPPDPATAA